MKTEVICKECKYEYKIKEIKSKRITEDINEHYFVCPECSVEQNCFYDDKVVRKLMQHQKNLRFRLQKSTSIKRKQKVWDELQETNEKIAAEMDRVRELVESNAK
ncbi:hypothetical protein J0835_28715 [Bacillus cereus group sp. Sample62]|uniref:hypothetical protein n=1 Tax=unclassified Bacillus cereus group TaxID=2750818 RepID=UPI00086EA6FF|nr:hypothetical protein [Bacillus cereus group sp. BfR-BA-01324]SCN40908.1 Uncharacterized protein BC067498_05466 [Bacillus cereus]HDR4727317.1 hypothetical protein [Bacillus cereus]